MKLENELFLATIEWTWECCLKQKDDDNEKNITLSKAYKSGKFGMLQAVQVKSSGEIEYRKIFPYRYDDIIYMEHGVFLLSQNHKFTLKQLSLTANFSVSVVDAGYGFSYDLVWKDTSGILLMQHHNLKNFYNPQTGYTSDDFEQLEIAHGYALAKDYCQYALIDLTSDKTVAANPYFPYRYLCDYQDGCIFLAEPNKKDTSDTFPMQIVFCNHGDHNATAFELTARPDIVAELRDGRFLARNISLIQDGEPLVLRCENGSAITRENIFKAKSFSNLLRRVADLQRKSP